MSENVYLKCACPACGGRIEFPAEALGRLVDCPHCGKQTSLQGPSAAPGGNPSAAVTPPPPAAPSPQRKTISPRSSPVAVPGLAAKPEPGNAKATAEPEPAPPPAAKNVGRKCKQCGAEMSAGAKICVQCGAGIRKKGPLVWGVAVLVVAVAGAARWWGWNKRQQANAVPAVVAVPIATNKPPVAPEVTKEPKSPNDLKVSALTIEKSKSSGKDKAKTSELVYAVGTVNNESDWQRFGVKVTCELFDAKGENLGTATDYVAVLEPRKSWTFRALALDKKAVSARLLAIKEDD